MPVSPSDPRPGVLAPEVELDDVTAILDHTPVLHRLGLLVPAGQVTVVMGPSGVGKTTLIKLIVGLLEPAGGRVRIGGRDLWDATPEQRQEIRRGIGAMLGGHNLFDTSVFGSLTVLDNLTFSLHAQGVRARQREQRALAQLRELDLAEVADLTPDRLPAHARKRLALARALVLDAPLTVLDELELAIDLDHADAVLGAVRNLRARTGGTLLVTTHTVELARTLADQLAVLVHGRIVAAGPPAELLAGVHDAEDFDRRFRFSEHVGPPRALGGLPPSQPVGAGSGADRRLAWLALLAVAMLLALYLVLRVIYAGALPGR